MNLARRGENIYKRKDGRWEGRYIKKRRSDKSIHYGYVYARTFREVRMKLLEKKQEYAQVSQPYLESLGTVSDWIIAWLEGPVKRKVKISTLASYRYKLKRYVQPLIGKVLVQSLDYEQLQTLINQLAAQDLATSTIRLTIQILQQVLKEALEQGYLAQAAFRQLTFPEGMKRRIGALSTKEQAKLEAHALASKHGLPILIALHTGLRIGEISALRWSDIHFERKELVVTRTLQRVINPREGRQTQIIEGFAKSPTSQRVIPLNTKICQLLLNAQKQTTSPYVIGKNEHFYEPRALTYQFKKILAKAKLVHWRFHQLRHTFATRLLEKGADVATVSALLGHHSTKMTLDVYTDSLMSQRKKWVNRLI